MLRPLLTTTSLLALAASGCAVAPHGQAGEQTVTHDVVNYLQREWPLHGPPVVPAGAQPCGFGCCGVGSDGGACTPEVYSDDWDQPGVLPATKGYSMDPPPAVPLDPPPAGRFFPAPTQPAFAPQAPQGLSTAGFGPMPKAAG